MCIRDRHEVDDLRRLEASLDLDRSELVGLHAAVTLALGLEHGRRPRRGLRLVATRLGLLGPVGLGFFGVFGAELGLVLGGGLVRRFFRRHQLAGLPDLLDLLALPGLRLPCLLYTSDAADERSSVDLGGPPIIKKKNNTTQHNTRDKSTK